MNRKTLFAIVAAAATCTALHAAVRSTPVNRPDEPTAASLATIGESLAPSLVRVEYTVQYDKGESPGADYYSSWRLYAGGMGSFDDGAARPFANWDSFIDEERPAEFPGYLISPTRVVTRDPALHPRFIKEINVRFGATLVRATPVAYGKEQGAVFLDLSAPLPDSKPLSFDPQKPGPYIGATYAERDGAWTIFLGSSPTRAGIRADGAKPGERLFGGGEGVFLDRSGTPVGLWLGGSSRTEDAWKGSPEKWPVYSVKEMDDMLARTEVAASSAIVRVSLNFRSPPARADGMDFAMRSYMGRDFGQQEITQWHGSGVMVDDRTVLVLANFKPKTTGRLERIQVFTPSGEIKASFQGTLKNYGGFLASLDAAAPTTPPARLFAGDITSLRNQLLLQAEITVHGEIRTAYYSRQRIGGYYLGWRRQVLPAMSPSRTTYASYSPYGGETPGSLNFLFTPEGELVCIPLAHREKVATQDAWGGQWSPPSAGQMTPAAYVAEVIAARQASFDPENRPVTEKEENRLAWLGVEMQPMDPDLARENNVTDQTRGGASGAMVTYVYPNSPAARAGIEMGDILLRVHVDGQPKPIEVQVTGDLGFGGMMDMFWESLEGMPAEYLDQMPKPWGSVENPLVRALTDVGFGTPFKAELFRSGTVVMKDFVVEQGPDHYESAKRFKCEAGGFTARDLTYEVRRFFQLKEEDPGVIISKIEQGEKAAVAGLRPYELITSVNDTPVKTSDELEKALAAGGDLRLNVKRMTTGRIVKIKLEPASSSKKDAE